jgi:hypothetical protein
MPEPGKINCAEVIAALTTVTDAVAAVPPAALEVTV